MRAVPLRIVVEVNPPAHADPFALSVDHRLEERIRAHVLLCWLALLLVRVAENHTGQAWPAMRRELQRIAIGTFTGPAGTFRQRTDIPKTARDLLATLKIDVPRKIRELTTPDS